MKKSNSVKAVVFLVLITVAVAAICFFVRTDIPEGTLRIDYNGQRVDLLLEQFELVPVQGTVINGKGEERNINVQGGSPDLPICARSLLSRAEVGAGLAVQVAVERDVIVLRDLEHEAVD